MVNYESCCQGYSVSSNINRWSCGYVTKIGGRDEAVYYSLGEEIITTLSWSMVDDCFECRIQLNFFNSSNPTFVIFS